MTLQDSQKINMHPLAIFISGRMRAMLFLMLIVLSPLSVMAEGGSEATPQAGPGKLDADLAVFEPAAEYATRRIDYAAMDFALGHIVADFGLSDRRSLKPRSVRGSRLKAGIEGDTALEGNRVMFSQLDKEQIAVLTLIREALERVGTQTDFAVLGRKQQLAYWFNLHNFAMIEQIALHYPVEFPDKIHPDASGLPLEDAKILNVKGVPLSLRDIRTRIVYRRWSSPMVLYGFFHGKVGGPSIQTQAYTGANVDALLSRNAYEFITSLRGVRAWGKQVRVSYIYGKSEGFFPNRNYKLRAHIYAIADTEVKREMDSGKLFVDTDRFNRVADMLGGRASLLGRAQMSEVNVESYNNGYASGLSAPGLSGFPGMTEDMAALRGALLHKWHVLNVLHKTRQTTVIVGEDLYAPARQKTGDDAPEKTGEAKPDQ